MSLYHIYVFIQEFTQFACEVTAAITSGLWYQEVQQESYMVDVICYPSVTVFSSLLKGVVC